MSDDLVAQLLEQASSDHNRGCEGRQYSCDCGYDIRTEGLLEQAAQALTEARAEIERLREERDVANANHRQMATTMVDLARKHDTLRARVREVVAPFAEFDHATISSKPETCVISRGRIPSVLTLADFEAARQLMEEVK